MKKCINCLYETNENEFFCPNCGSKLVELEDEVTNYK